MCIKDMMDVCRLKENIAGAFFKYREQKPNINCGD
jgi:hypothetical protein